MEMAQITQHLEQDLTFVNMNILTGKLFKKSFRLDWQELISLW